MKLLLPNTNRGAVLLLSACLALAGLGGCRFTNDTELNDAPAQRRSSGVRLAEAAGEQWPGFRGVNGTGVSSAANLPVTWDDRLGVRWSTAVPGDGNSSPVVWNDHIFLTTADEHREVKLLCYDRADGALRWQQSAGHATGRRHAKNGDASPTPVTDGNRVFAFFGGLGMICCDLDGNLLWRQSLGDVDHPWGIASSPILFDDLVIQLYDGEPESSLFALKQDSGEIVWRTTRDSTGCWSTPAVMAYGQGASRTFSVVVNGTGCELPDEGQVIGYDPRNGAEQWRVRGASDAGVPAPLVAGDMVVVASGRKGNTMLLRPSTNDNPALSGPHDRSTTDCEVVWVIPHSGPFVPTGVVYEGLLYQIGDLGVFTCYDASSGETLYEQRLAGNYSAGLIAGDGKIYATSEEGRTYVVRAGASYELLSTNDLHAPVLATPAVAGGDLLVRTDRQLVCIPAQLPEPASVNEAAPFENEDDSPSQTLR